MAIEQYTYALKNVDQSPEVTRIPTKLSDGVPPYAEYGAHFNGTASVSIPLRVLIFTESFHPYTSGIARRFKEIVRRLVLRGYRIHIVTGCKGADSWIKGDATLEKHVSHAILRSLDFKDRIDCSLPFIYPQPAIVRELKQFGPDVVHVVEHTPGSILCACAARSLGLPIIWSQHTALDSYIPLYIRPIGASLSIKVYQFWRAWFVNMSTQTLTVSRDFASVLEATGIRNVKVWKTGVDTELFRPELRSAAMRKKLCGGVDLGPDTVLLVSVGRLSPEKNFEFLLHLIERLSNVFLSIVGDGPYREALEPVFPKDRTHFTGFLHGDELAAAYASADLFVYASTSETFGQVYLEAMASGIAVVAAEGKQMKEFFVSGQHGYLWQPGDVDSACAAVTIAIQENEKLMRNARTGALMHNWDNAANQIAETYEESQKCRRPVSTLGSLLSSLGLGVVYIVMIINIVSILIPCAKTTKPQIGRPRNGDSSQRRSSPCFFGCGAPSRRVFLLSTAVLCFLFIMVCYNGASAEVHDDGDVISGWSPPLIN